MRDNSPHPEEANTLIAGMISGGELDPERSFVLFVITYSVAFRATTVVETLPSIRCDL